MTYPMYACQECGTLSEAAYCKNCDAIEFKKEMKMDLYGTTETTGTTTEEKTEETPKSSHQYQDFMGAELRPDYFEINPAVKFTPENPKMTKYGDLERYESMTLFERTAIEELSKIRILFASNHLKGVHCQIPQIELSSVDFPI